MATKYYKFKGPCKWAKLHTPDQKYNNYQINVYLDDEGIKQLKDSGLQLSLKTDEDGSFVTFRRPQQKIIKGQLVDLGKPRVEDKDRKPLEALVGNGSMVTVDVSVYDTLKGKGHTMMGVQVTDLVIYERSTDA